MLTWIDCSLVSRPEEFHLQSLSEPDVRLSTHPAPIIPARTALPCSWVLPFRLTLKQNGITQPLRSSSITRIHHYYGLFRPCIPLQYSDPCGASTWISPFASEYRFPSSVSKPVPCSRLLHTGHRLDSNPDERPTSGFFRLSSWIRYPPDLSRDRNPIPVLMTSLDFRHFNRGSVLFVSIALTWLLMEPFPILLTTITLRKQQHMVVWNLPLQGGSGRPTPIFDIAWNWILLSYPL